MFLFRSRLNNENENENENENKGMNIGHINTQHAMIFELKLTIETYKDIFSEYVKDHKFDIQDEIVHKHDTLGEIVTRFKLRRYNNMKFNRQKNVNNYLIDQSNYTHPADNFVWDNKGLDIESNILVNNSKNIDGTDDNDNIEEIITTIQNDYKLYYNKALTYLTNYNFFKHNLNVFVDVKNIMTMENYHRYLTEVLEKLFNMSARIVKTRYANNDTNTSVKYLMSHHSNNTLFYFPNNEEFNKDLDTFKKYVLTLYILIHTIPCTVAFVNKYLNTHISCKEMSDMEDKRRKLNQQLYNLKNDINTQEILDTPMAATSCSEYFTKYFIQKRADNTIILPFSSYCKQIDYCFEKAKINNELLRIKCEEIKNKDAIENIYIDYCEFLF